MNLATFIATYNGQYVSYYNTSFQCMDLYRMYVKQVWQLPQTPGVIGAYQVFNTINPLQYTLIPYDGIQVPQAGDVVCWDTGFSAFGHIAIVNTATGASMQVFEQNDPLGSPAVLATHGYSHVIGWFRPIGGSSPVPPPVAQPIVFQDYVLINGKKYPVLSGSYSMKWDRAFSSEIAGSILRLNFIDKGPGIRTFSMTLLLKTWPAGSLVHDTYGITDTWDIQLQNLEAAFGLLAQVLPFTDPLGRSPGAEAQNGVFFTNMTTSMPKYSTPNGTYVLVQIELTEATQLINGGQNNV